MATVRELITTWGFKIDLKSLDRMDARVGALTKDVGKVGENINRVAQGMVGFGTRMTAFVTVPIIALGAVLAKTASDAEETESKFEAVFSGISNESGKVAKNLRDNFGLGATEAKKLLADTGDLLTGFGFSQKAALELSKNVQELAVDLSSFTNNAGGAQGASVALTKALLGERESVKLLGIAILEEDVKKQVALDTANGLTFESLRQAKAFATLQIAMSQSKNAIGDFAKTQGSTANQLKLLTRDLKDEADVLGKLLIPAFRDLIRMGREAVFWFSQLEEGTKDNIILFLGMVAIVGPLILGLGLLGISIIAIVRAYAFLKIGIIAARTAMLGFTLVSLIFPVIALGLGLALGVLIDDFRNFFAGNKSLLGEWLGEWVIVKEGLLGVYDQIVEGTSKAMEKISNIIKNPIKEIKSLISDLKFLPGFISDTLGLSDIQNQSFLPGGGVLLQPAGGGTINRNSNRVTTHITMSIPEGTPEQQIAQVEEAGKRVVQDEIDLILRRLNNDSPEVE